MRHIVKGEAPPELQEWKGLASEEWQPSFASLQNPQKSVLKQALLREQGHLCCYCNGPVEDRDSHIEHFRPQSLFPELELDYANLHVSCQSNQARGLALHCGMAKGEWFDSQLTLSPLADDIEQRLRYSDDGHVYPADPADAAAEASISHLALDCPLLIDKRENTIRGVLDEEFLASADMEDLEHLLHALQQADGRGHLMPYVLALRQQVEGLLGAQRG